MEYSSKENARFLALCRNCIDTRFITYEELGRIYAEPIVDGNLKPTGGWKPKTRQAMILRRQRLETRIDS